MSHVDDGALHAYLDGALGHLPPGEASRIREHLGSCPACAERLEEERALRAEAHAILTGADPGVGDVPPLEELQERARHAGGQERVSAGFRLRRLAWAASMVVAVGAGWMLRGSQAGRFEPLLTSPPEAPAGAVADEASPDAGAPTGPAERGAQVQADLENEATQEDARFAQEIPQTAPSQAPVARRVATDGEAPEPQVLGVAPAASPGVALRDRGEMAGVREDEVAAPRERAVVLGGGVDALRDSLEARLGQPLVAVSEAKSGAGLQPSAPASLEFRIAPRRTDTGVGAQAVRIQGAQDVAADQAVVRQRTQGLVSGMPVVPGWAVVSVTSADASLPPGSVRIVQELDGDTLELIHIPGGGGAPIPGGAPAQGDAPVPGDDGAGERAQVVRSFGAGWVVVRARLTQEALSALVARIVQGG